MKHFNIGPGFHGLGEVAIERNLPILRIAETHGLFPAEGARGMLPSPQFSFEESKCARH